MLGGSLTALVVVIAAALDGAVAEVAPEGLDAVLSHHFAGRDSTLPFNIADLVYNCL